VGDTLSQLAALKDDFLLYAPACLKIKTKAGTLVQFKPNRAQLYVHERLEEQKRETGRVRALILKARQQGFSTYIAGRYYHKASLTHGTSVFILTHEQPATDNLFNMVARYHEHTPLKPSTGAANAKELLFNRLDSGYSVATAGQKAVGRSKTVQLFHGSEVAFWPNAGEHFAGVMQAIPDLPGTEVVLESTANGISGEFYERWQQAEAGVGDYIAIFVPWFWAEEYRRTVPEGFSLRTEKMIGEDIAEAEYAKLHGLDLEQMVWRRAKIAELKDPALFMQEYPATAEEAFQATGHDSFIKSVHVLRARKNVIDEPLGALVIGVDPSRFGDDLFAIVWRRGRKVLKKETIEKIDTVEAANKLKQIIDIDKPTKMFIDVGGQGAGVYDLLVSYGAIYADCAVGVNFGGEPQEPVIRLPDGGETPGPRNRRAEMWMRSRDWLMDELGVDIPDEPVFQSDAVGPSYKYDSSQRLILESKESMRKRGIRSPDVWDAVALTFAEWVYDAQQSVKPREVTTMYRAARRQATGWMAA
jgi:hypothetical protein